jgi:peptidoglycan hydrolase CwlO-like protein
MVTLVAMALAHSPRPFLGQASITRKEQRSAPKMSAKLIVNVIPVLGSLILFLSWVFQQTLLEDANSTLQKIYNARTVYQTYQSNNAMFNAIIETVENDRESVEEKIRKFQIYNYELGLRDMEALLNDEARADIPEAPHAYSTTQSADVMLNTTQDRLTKIQVRLAAKENEIVSRKSTLNKMFLGLYAVGSTAVLVGSVLSVLVSSEAGVG